MADEGQEQGPGAAPAPAGETPPVGEPGEVEALRGELARLRDEAKREADRLRNEAGQANRRLREIEDREKPELQRLTEQAGRVPTLETRLAEQEAEIERLRGVFSAQSEATRKALEATDRSLLGLLPDGLTAEQEFAWLTKALGKAQKDAAEAAKRGALPPAGGRNPGTGAGKEGPTKEEQERVQQSYLARW